MYYAHPHDAAQPELLALGPLVALGAGWLLVRWVQTAPARPDPWESAAGSAADLREPDTWLCYRCLGPHSEAAKFCPDCGAAVGPYNNYDPFLFLFSVGQWLRTGTREPPRRGWLFGLGFALAALGAVMILAPAYWVVLAWNRRRSRRNRSVTAAASG